MINTLEPTFKHNRLRKNKGMPNCSDIPLNFEKR